MLILNRLIMWVNVFMIISKFRILSHDFPYKASLKMLNWADSNSFSDLYSFYLTTINHLTLIRPIFLSSKRLLFMSVAYIQVNFKLDFFMEANYMCPDQTAIIVCHIGYLRK